jgi:hypothetical protein
VYTPSFDRASCRHCADLGLTLPAGHSQGDTRQGRHCRRRGQTRPSTTLRAKPGGRHPGCTRPVPRPAGQPPRQCATYHSDGRAPREVPPPWRSPQSGRPNCATGKDGLDKRLRVCESAQACR